MKITAALLVTPLLALFVTWLSLRAINSGDARYNAALNELDRISQTEAALQRDVLGLGLITSS